MLNVLLVALLVVVHCSSLHIRLAFLYQLAYAAKPGLVAQPRSKEIIMQLCSHAPNNAIRFY